MSALTSAERERIRPILERMERHARCMRGGLETQGRDGLREDLETILDQEDRIRSILEGRDDDD